MLDGLGHGLALLTALLGVAGVGLSGVLALLLQAAELLGVGLRITTEGCGTGLRLPSLNGVLADTRLLRLDGGGGGGDLLLLGTLQSLEGFDGGFLLFLHAGEVLLGLLLHLAEDTDDLTGVTHSGLTHQEADDLVLIVGGNGDGVVNGGLHGGDDVVAGALQEIGLTTAEDLDGLPKSVDHGLLFGFLSLEVGELLLADGGGLLK